MYHDNQSFRSLFSVDKDRGFSLIELVIVVSVLSILAGIAIPTFDDLRKQAMIKTVKLNLLSIVKECQIKAIEIEPGSLGGASFKHISWNLPLKFNGYSNFYRSLGFTYPLLSDEDPCHSITAKSDPIPGTSIGALPHFQIFYDYGRLRFSRLCDVDSNDTYNKNLECDKTRPRSAINNEW